MGQEELKKAIDAIDEALNGLPIVDHDPKKASPTLTPALERTAASGLFHLRSKHDRNLVVMFDGNGLNVIS